LDSVKAMGFNWMKLSVSWKELEPSRGSYQFNRIDSTVNRAVSQGFKLLIRVDDTPDWASSRPGSQNAPPSDPNTLAAFMGELAQHLKGRVHAYEIWNEPNLFYEWGGMDPDPIRYGEMLKALYPRVKSVDPNVTVVTGGLSTAGDNTSGPVMGDLYFLAKLFDPNQDHSPSDGYGAYLDAVGTHPYGGPYRYDTPSSVARNDVGLFFRRAEEQRGMVEAWAKVDKPLWATEFGWLVDPAEYGLSCDLGSYFNRLKVSSQAQADNLLGAYQYAEANWPWMGPMFMFNFDMARDPWRPACEQVRFFSILNSSGFNPAYQALKDMPKASGFMNTPAALWPGDGSTVTLGSDLVWSIPEGTRQVHLRVTPASNDGPGVDLIFGSAFTGFTIPAPPQWYGMLPGMTYTWQMRSSTATVSIDADNASWSGWSPPARFKTPPPSSTTISPVQPSDGSTVSSRTPTVVWSNSDPAIFYYEVQLSKDPSFNTNPATAIASVYWELRHGGVTSPPNSYTIAPNARLESETQYYWRVRPRVQGDGIPVAWSTTWSFETP